MKHTFVAKKNRGGYLLVEIMVSLSIFAIVAVSSTAALLAIIDANTKAQNMKSVMDNLSVAVENMSRTIRIGSDYKCINEHLDAGAQDSSCQSGTKGISFLPQDASDSSDRVEYYYKEDPDPITGEMKGIIYRNRKDGSGNWVEAPLTAPEVVIKKFDVRLFGAGASQPRVLLIINGEAALGKQTPTAFNLQTTVVQRDIATP